MLKVLYFATLREHMGRAEEDLSIGPEIATVADLVRKLAQRDPAVAIAFARPTLVRAAVNQEFAQPAAPIRDGDEIAFFPPVTGG